MAGRPVDLEFRSQRLAEVDDAIQSLKSRQMPIIRKTIAEEMGITVQALYGPGYLSEYIKELEMAGVISNARAGPTEVTDAERKALLKENKKLKAENARLTKKNADLTMSLKKREQEVASLSEEIKQIKGELFQIRKIEFAQKRI